MNSPVTRIVDYSDYPVPGVPNTWGAVPPSDALTKAKAAADYVVNALGSPTVGFIKGDPPESVKKSVSYAEAWSATQDGRNIVADAVAHSGIEGAPFDAKQYTLRSAANFTPDKAVYHSASQISQACTLHLKIQSRRPELTVSDSYRSLISEGVITEDDLPFLLRFNPAARNLPGFPLAEKTALQAFGTVSYWAFWLTDTIKNYTLGTEKQRMAQRLVVHKERIPAELLSEILAPHAYQSEYWRNRTSTRTKASLVKAIKIATYISDEKARKGSDYVVDTGTLPPILIPLALFVNAVSGLLQAANATLDWALNITIGDAANMFDPTADDVANLQTLVSAAYNYRPSSSAVPDQPVDIIGPKGIGDGGLSLDGRIRLSGGGSFSGRVKFEEMDPAGMYAITSSRYGSGEDILLLERLAGGYYSVTVPASSSGDSRVEILSGATFIALSKQPTNGWHKFAVTDSATISIVDKSSTQTKKAGRIRVYNGWGSDVDSVVVRHRVGNDKAKGETTHIWKPMAKGAQGDWQDFWYNPSERNYWWVSVIVGRVQYVCGDTFYCSLTNSDNGDVNITLQSNKTLLVDFSSSSGCSKTMSQQ